MNTTNFESIHNDLQRLISKKISADKQIDNLNRDFWTFQLGRCVTAGQLCYALGIEQRGSDFENHANALRAILQDMENQT